MKSLIINRGNVPPPVKRKPPPRPRTTTAKFPWTGISRAFKVIAR